MFSLNSCESSYSQTERPGSQVYHNIGEAVQGIVKQKGVRGLYSGLSVTLMEIIPYAALQFGFYDAFTAAYANTRRHINPQVSE